MTKMYHKMLLTVQASENLMVSADDVVKLRDANGVKVWNWLACV